MRLCVKYCSFKLNFAQFDRLECSLDPCLGLHQLSGPCQGRDHTPAFWYILVDVDRHRSSVLFGANLPSGTDLHAEIDMKRTWNTHPVLIISHLKWDKVAMKVSRFKLERCLSGPWKPVATRCCDPKHNEKLQVQSNFIKFWGTCSQR